MPVFVTSLFTAQKGDGKPFFDGYHLDTVTTFVVYLEVGMFPLGQQYIVAL